MWNLSETSRRNEENLKLVSLDMQYIFVSLFYRRRCRLVLGFSISFETDEFNSDDAHVKETRVNGEWGMEVGSLHNVIRNWISIPLISVSVCVWLCGRIDEL